MRLTDVLLLLLILILILFGFCVVHIVGDLSSLLAAETSGSAAGVDVAP